MLCPGKCIAWCVWLPLMKFGVSHGFPVAVISLPSVLLLSNKNVFFFWVFPCLWCESLLLIQWVLVLCLLVVQLQLMLLLFPLEKIRFALLILCCCIKECCSYDVLLDLCGVLGRGMTDTVVHSNVVYSVCVGSIIIFISFHYQSVLVIQ